MLLSAWLHAAPRLGRTVDAPPPGGIVRIYGGFGAGTYRPSVMPFDRYAFAAVLADTTAPDLRAEHGSAVASLRSGNGARTP